MSTQKGKWLAAGLMAVSLMVVNQGAQAHSSSAEAIFTGLAVGAVTATLLDNDRHHHHHYHRPAVTEVHHYYAPPPPPPRVVEYHYHGRRDYHRGHGGRHHHGHGHHGGRPRSVIVNHF